MTVTKEQRAREMIALGSKMEQAYLHQWVGREAYVLAEEPVKDRASWMQGYTAEYVRVEFPGSETLSGQMVGVRLEENGEGSLRGACCRKRFCEQNRKA